MGFLGPAIGAGAAWLLFTGDAFWLGCVAAAFALISLWTWGIMHNQATEAAKRRLGFRGDFFDFRASEIAAVSDKLTVLNFFSTFGAAVMMGVALLRITA